MFSDTEADSGLLDDGGLEKGMDDEVDGVPADQVAYYRARGCRPSPTPVPGVRRPELENLDTPSGGGLTKVLTLTIYILWLLR